jgi:integrase
MHAIHKIKEVNELLPFLSTKQIAFINKLSIPPTLLLKNATAFDTKRIETGDDLWKYSFSGRDHVIKFTGEKNTIQLKKYILVSYISKNSPSSLDKHSTVLDNLFNISYHLDGFSYKSSVLAIDKFTDQPNFYFALFIIRALCTIDFPDFSYNKLEDLEFIRRPVNDAWLSYQNIDNVLSTYDKNLINKGLKEISVRINSSEGDMVTEQELMDSSVLGLCYTCGIRPVQIARLAVMDLRVDASSSKDNFKRYSISIPYAKQQKLVIDKALIAIPSDLANILKEYERRLNKKPDEQFFNIGYAATGFVNRAINRQMLRFAPEDIREAINNNLMLQPLYNSYDFRHNVGHSLAMSGASADEIAYILGHSTLVAAKNYIMATPELALVRAKVLGTNPVWQTMISMMLTGSIIQKSDWKGKEVFGVIDGSIHTGIGGCSRSYVDCPFSEVRACYGCLYYNPFVEGDHQSVLSSIKNELIDLIEISDSIGCSNNPLIQVHESTKIEVESVITRCRIYQDDSSQTISQKR